MDEKTEQNSGDDFSHFLRNNALALTLQGLGVLVLLANLWLAAQLSPLAKSIDQVNARTVILERESEKGEVLVERFFVVEERVKTIDSTIRDVQSDVKLLLRQKVEEDNN